MYTPKTYKDLIFWKKSIENTKILLSLMKKIHKSPANSIIINQLLRSLMSIGANIAEGYGRFGGKEFTRFLHVSLGSANESDYWLLLLKENNPSFSREIEKIIESNTEVIKMLAKSLKTLRNK